MIANRSTKPWKGSNFSLWDVARKLEQARLILKSPPRHDRLVRVVPIGELVREFVLPLELVQPQNQKSGQKAWARSQKTTRTFRCLMAQNSGMRQDYPLLGRPQVICVRFSSVEPDKYTDSFKVAIDRLCVYKPRKVRSKTGLTKLSKNTNLGYLADDKPSAIDLHQTWEYAKPGEGFGYIAIYTGETT